MGTTVERYRLGITVPQGDIDAMVEAILSLTAPREAAQTIGGETTAPLREEFLELHSDERLSMSFASILAGRRETRRPSRPAVAPATDPHLSGRSHLRGEAPPTEP
jgi:hypothetical protein